MTKEIQILNGHVSTDNVQWFVLLWLSVSQMVQAHHRVNRLGRCSRSILKFEINTEDKTCGHGDISVLHRTQL
jgi:hypothetical protein